MSDATDKVQNLIDAATEGPWNVWDGPSYVGGGADLCIGAGEEWLANMDHRTAGTRCSCPSVDILSIVEDEEDADNITTEQRGTARFIAASITLLPAALEVVKAVSGDNCPFCKAQGERWDNRSCCQEVFVIAQFEWVVKVICGEAT